MKMYELLTKREVKMAGYWPCFDCVFIDWDEAEVNKPKNGQYENSLTEQISLVTKDFIIWFSGKCFLQERVGSPEQVR